jgi:predicted enzyme related to lactoylglutathione lyase
LVTRDTPWPDGTPCWIDLGTSDIPKAIAFYSHQFGWEVQQGGEEVGGYSMATVNGLNIAGIGPLQGPPGTPSAWTTYIATSNADATADKIKNAGGQLMMAPMDVMDFGRMAIAADVTGAVFGLWQPGTVIGAQVANVPGAFTWNEHMSRDFEGAKAFYSAVFGYEYGDMSTDGFSYATLLINGQQVVGGIGAYPAGMPESHPAAWTVYFGTADTDKSVETATGNGGRVIRPAEDSPYGRMAVVADDQGAVFSLIATPAEE